MLNGAVWLAAMRNAAPAIKVPKRAAFEDALLDEHVRAHEADPELYALSAIADGASAAQQSRVLVTLLGSRRDVPDAARVASDRVVAQLLAQLPADDVIAVFLALRKRRDNHKHTSRAMLRWVFGHPRVPFANRRAALVDIVEHALGRDVARACLKHVVTRTPDGDRYLARTLHRLAGGDRKLVEGRLLALATNATPPAIERAASIGESEATIDVAAPVEVEPPPELPKTVTATNRGDIAATLVHIYRGGDSPALRRGLTDFVDRAAAKLPAFDGALALIVDASHSTLGYGERMYCTISQSWALRLVLGKRCARLAVFVVGDKSDPPEPQGATDLVAPLLDALAEDPDVVAIVTDGYENRSAGELAQVIAALPAAGIDTPVVVINSKFTHKDDLTLRTPAPAAPSVDMWHEHDFAGVLETVGAAARGPVGRAFLHRALADRLSALERTQLPWTLHSNPYR
jgi:hypothetical protein